MALIVRIAQTTSAQEFVLLAFVVKLLSRSSLRNLDNGRHRTEIPMGYFHPPKGGKSCIYIDRKLKSVILQRIQYLGIEPDEMFDFLFD